MARERMVTRTVSQTTYTVMCLDTTTAEVSKRDFALGGNLDNNAALKLLRKREETDNLKLVAIVATRNDEILYGMPEADFIRYAKVLPPRTAADGDNA